MGPHIVRTCVRRRMHDCIHVCKWERVRCYCAIVKVMIALSLSIVLSLFLLARFTPQIGVLGSYFMHPNGGASQAAKPARLFAFGFPCLSLLQLHVITTHTNTHSSGDTTSHALAAILNSFVRQCCRLSSSLKIYWIYPFILNQIHNLH